MECGCKPRNYTLGGDDTEDRDPNIEDSELMVVGDQGTTYSQAHEGVEMAIAYCQRFSELMKHVPALQGVRDAMEKRKASKQKQPSLLDMLQ